MQKSNLACFAILFIAVIVLYVAQFSDKKATSQTTVNETPVSTPITNANQAFKVAYINLDSVMIEYSYYKELNEQLISKQMKAENQLSTKMKALEKDYTETQEKVQKGLMTRAEIAQAEESLNSRQQELAELQQKLSNDLAIEEQRLVKMLADTVKAVVADFNKDNTYDMIMNNFQNSVILSGQPSMNITDTILVILNKRHEGLK